jgi:hypothetical protein
MISHLELWSESGNLLGELPAFELFVVSWTLSLPFEIRSQTCAWDVSMILLAQSANIWLRQLPTSLPVSHSKTTHCYTSHFTHLDTIQYTTIKFTIIFSITSDRFFKWQVTHHRICPMPRAKELCLEGTDTSEEMRNSVNLLLERNRCKWGALMVASPTERG